MTLPPPAEFPREAAVALAGRLGLPSVPEVTARWSGATSTVLRWGAELTVKLPHADASAVEACLRHTDVCRAAAALGVVVPEILLVAELRPWLDAPVIVSRLLPGRSLRPGEDAPAVWRSVGGQLARLHAATPVDVPRGLRRFVHTPEVDPAAMIGRLAAAGALDPAEAARLHGERDRLVAAVFPDDAQVFCHGDIHAENVVVHEGRFGGLLDFAGAGWLDSAWDFAAMPPVATASALVGYAEAGGRTGGLAERIAWCRLQLSLTRREAAIRGR